MVNRLSAPGVREAAYNEAGIFDPAAAERYTSAYLFGKRFAPAEPVRKVLHGISGGSRALMSKLGVPGVHEEREELGTAERAGMTRGSDETAAQSYARALFGG
jgi:hypothetical protein